MPKRYYGVFACLLLAGIALTQIKTYTVREGDSLSKIASKAGVSQASIAKANNLSDANKLKPGMKLQIPKQQQATTAAKPGSSYTVRKGDNDWAIAKQLNVSVAQLHAANPKVVWTSIKPGQAIAIPTAQQRAQVAAKFESRMTSGGYAVKTGDNDWTIAKKFSITPSQLRALNPGVNWKAVQIGQKINVPGAKAVTASIPNIKTRYAVINADDVTIRRGPDVSHNAITKVSRSTSVTVLDRTGSWYKLKFPHGTVGWVRGDFLKPVSSVQVAQNKRKANSFVKKTTTGVASNVNRKSTRNSTRKSSGGGKVLAFDTSGAKSDVLSLAREMLGTRYRWGGASRSGTDCSGFTSQVYKRAGVTIPRTSRQQFTVGKTVSKSGLQKGDLVFFTNRSGRRIGHVGIYIGDNKFIHSSSGAGKVKVDSLTGYYSRRYAGARRVKAAAPAKAVAKKAEPKNDVAKAAPKNDDSVAQPDEKSIVKADEKKEETTPPITKATDEIGK